MQRGQTENFAQSTKMHKTMVSSICVWKFLQKRRNPRNGQTLGASLFDARLKKDRNRMKLQ